jgi:hypothetical protein
VRHQGADVVVELNSESRARRPMTWARVIIRRADRSYRLAGQRTSHLEHRHAIPPDEGEIVADAQS